MNRWILPPLLLGVLLALSNWRLVRENRRLGETARYYASLRHTPTGVSLPDLHGKDLNGADLTISYANVNRPTLLFVFSPTCPHCKRNWPAWLTLAGEVPGARVVFVNVGPPFTPDFSKVYSFNSVPVMAATSPESILRYSLLEFPLTVLISPGGRSEKVYVGELAASDLQELRHRAVAEPDVHVGMVR